MTEPRGNARRAWQFALVLVALGLYSAGCSSVAPGSVFDFFFDRRRSRSNDPRLANANSSSRGARPRVVHPPFAKGQCGRCHAQAGTAWARVTRKDAAPGELPEVSLSFTEVDPSSPKKARTKCLMCHTNPAEVSSRALIAPKEKWLHGPVANVQCVRCHEHHDSAYPKLLKAERVETLCVKCHVAQPRTKAMKALDCPQCHNPHNASSPSARFLRETKPGDLCLTCHREKIVGDPTRPWLHAPTANGLCVRCHSPHAGDARAIRRPIRDVCISCHGAAVVESRPEHAPERGDCDQCHNPHNARSASEHFLK